MPCKVILNFKPPIWVCMCIGGLGGNILQAAAAKGYVRISTSPF